MRFSTTSTIREYFKCLTWLLCVCALCCVLTTDHLDQHTYIPFDLRKQNMWKHDSNGFICIICISNVDGAFWKWMKFIGPVHLTACTRMRCLLSFLCYLQRIKRRVLGYRLSEWERQLNSNKYSNSVPYFFIFQTVKPLTVNIMDPPSQLVAERRYEITCESVGSRPNAIITWYKGKRQLRRTKVRTHTKSWNRDGAPNASRATEWGTMVHGAGNN